MIDAEPAPEVHFTPDGPTVATPPETTGRYIVVFAHDADAPGVLATAGVREVASIRDLGGELDAVARTDTMFDRLGMAIVSDPGGLATANAADVGVLAVVPELIHHVRDGAYARGYADGTQDLATRLASAAPASADGDAAPGARAFRDGDAATWGIQATRADASSYSGAGIKVAVLDTGFDSTHPDFAGRAVTTASFIAGETSEDGHGHGTHCIGTSCGPLAPESGPRYGVAHGAEIFAGKVLSNAGSGGDSAILAGIDWAITQGCAIISMSLGADVPNVHEPYTLAGRRALDQGSLIVAAAGNNAQRTDLNFGFVGTPANSPHIAAVAALNQQLDVAFFSARTLPDARGGQVDLAGPGYQVYSSWPMPQRYRSISGTSMATPHVAGLAALWAEATGLRAGALWSILTQESHRLLAPSLDVGSGLLVAP
ncbi:S8 family serine peptidase [Demequina iriomotensis]|uniref:S8 family serine peptidase n=1 Tax=Demequina iriomotensis TaxID=1536641 RepID=UPI0007835595|nr:S8 family serine peptidase [Demequina iriomotensis]